jgi:hypothetical protein
MLISSIAVDDFYPAPNAVRHIALKLEYGSQEYQGHTYKGIGLGYKPEQADRFLGDVFGRPAKIEMEYFRLGTKNEEPTTYIHADQCIGEWAAVWYLSEAPSDVVAGTAFWRHKELGLTEMPDIAYATQKFGDKEFPADYLVQKLNEDGMDESKWDMVGLIPQKFNRLACYNSKLFHSRYPYNGFGTTPADGRIVWTAFFNL